MGKLCIAVDFGKRNFHIGMGERKVMTRNGGNRYVFHIATDARGYTKSGEYFAKMGYFDLEVLATQADFE